MTTARTFLAISLVALLLTAVNGCKKDPPQTPDPAPTQPTVTPDPPAPRIEEPRMPEMVFAPDFPALKDEAGNPVSLSDFEGSIVVLEWTNTDCPFVIRHYRPGDMTMVQLATKWQARNVVWLAINSTYGSTQESNAKWHRTKNLPYPVLDDASGQVGKLYNATRTPEIYVLDKERRIIYWGAIDNDPKGNMPLERVNYVDQALTEYLTGKPITTPRTRPYGCTVKYQPQTSATIE